MRLATKENRLELQAGQINSKLAKGYKLEEYKGLKIVTGSEKDQFYLTIYKDSAAHPIANYFFRQEERRTDYIAKAKESYDRTEEYKKKAKADKTSSTASNAAAAIKAELTQAFPGVKFSVKSDNFAGGDAVRISWADGPTTQEVEDISSKYQYGHFDGMEDMYVYSNRIEGLPQSKYVTESRSMSQATREALEASAKVIWNEQPEYFSKSGLYDSEGLAYRIFQKHSIPSNAKVLGIARTDVTCGLLESFYCLDIEVTEQPATATAPDYEKVEVPAGQVQIVDYSEKAIALIGDTKSIKDELKSLGGKFNPRLSCGAGWIFRKADLSKIESALNARLQNCAQ